MAARTVDTDLDVAGTVDATALTQGGSAVALGSTLSASGMGVVEHGAVASTARPTGWHRVNWIGTVEPTNAVNGDVWDDTS